MRLLVGALLGLASIPAAAPAGVRVELDVSQATAVLATIENGRLDERALERFRADPVTRAVVSHGAKFDARVTTVAWEAGLAAAAAKDPLPKDPLRFGEVLSQRKECAALLERLRTEREAVVARVSGAIAAYVPPGEDFAVTMHVVAGSNSTGWTSDDGTRFYFDVRAAGDDFEGMTTVVVHEIYHLALVRLLPKPRLDATSPLGQVERMLINGLDEGMATHVARDDGNGKGKLSRLNRRIATMNELRAAANFTLFSAMLVTAARNQGLSAEDAGVIAFSGAYDEFGYYLFRDMIREVERARGVPTLMKLVSESPSALVRAYHELPDTAGSLPRLTPAALQAIDGVDRARVRVSNL